MDIVVIDYNVVEAAAGQFVREGVELDPGVFETVSLDSSGRGLDYRRVVVYLKPFATVVKPVSETEVYRRV